MATIPEKWKKSLGEVLQQAQVVQMVQIEGESMAPAFRNGDWVKIVNTAEVAPGDVVLFEKAARRFLHRLVAVRPPLYLTKGDNCPWFDAPIGSRQIIGKAAAVERDGWELDLTGPREKLRGFLLALYSLYAGEAYRQYPGPAKAAFNLEQAGRLIEANRYAEAGELLRAALPLDNDNPRIWFSYGVALFRSGEEKQAREAFLRVQALSPGNWLCYTNLAEIYRREGDFKSALQQLRTMLRLNRSGPERAYACNLWGNVLVDLGDLPKALSKYRAALEILPDYRAAHLNCAWTLENLGRNQLAETHYRQALALGDADAKLYRAYAAFLLKTGRKTEAAALTKEALSRGIGFPGWQEILNRGLNIGG